MIDAIFKYLFMQRALLASVLISITAGIIGVIIVQKKLVMMSGGIAHTAYGGVGLGYLLGFEPILGGFLFAFCAAFGIGTIRRKANINADTSIALFWSLGMALGVFFIALCPGYPPDLNSYLFGNILSVTAFDIYLTIALTVIALISIVPFFNDWKAFLFDEEFAAVKGKKVVLMEYWLLLLVALTVVVFIRAAGIMLVISMLTAPAAAARRLSDKLSSNMIIATGLSLLYCLAGLWVSYSFNIPSGATIIVLSVIGFLASVLLDKIRQKCLLSQCRR